MVGAEVREVERKYDVDWSTPIPDLNTLPGVAQVAEPVEHELGAESVDTEDLALAANRITLRRRTGGDDDGWHLKLPGSGDERDELRRPGGTSARRVPLQLARLVRVHARGRALVPVATLRTRRVVHRLLDADGAVLAEVCDDRVSAQAGDTMQDHTWREWEVELVTGDEALLDAAGQA